VRLDRQRGRLFEAAAAVFGRVGYADATAEAIAREAGMSKATFYEHFDNKEDCIIALFDAAAESLLRAMREAGAAHEGEHLDRVRATVRSFLDVIAAYPDESRTLLVEIIGAGPRALERRDRVLADFASYIDEFNRADAEAGKAPRLRTLHDSFAIVGAAVELTSRQLRTGIPAEMRELEPVIQRLVAGLLEASRTEA
jgi:AcrR family transcriptional regulator